MRAIQLLPEGRGTGAVKGGRGRSKGDRIIRINGLWVACRYAAAAPLT